MTLKTQFNSQHKYLMTQKTIEIDRAINNLRVEILTVNTQRLSAKEQRESDLFAKDMERMELKIEVTTLKESIEEEIQENQSEIQQQKCEIQTLKDLIANAKERCEKSYISEYKAEVRRSRAIEQERMKEVKTNQKKLNIFIKQNQPNSYKNKSSTLDQECNDDHEIQSMYSGRVIDEMSVNGGYKQTHQKSIQSYHNHVSSSLTHKRFSNI